MKQIISTILLLAIGLFFPLHAQTITKPKVIITTDLGADNDDLQSLVRLLVQSNELDIKGIITATGCWRTSQSTANMDRYMNPILTAYEKAYPNLRVHSPDYPTLDYLKSVTVLGNTAYGMGGVGSGKDSQGSNLIIATVDAASAEYPVIVESWGGSNNVAQALYKVKNSRSASELDVFTSKFIVYDILGQDDAGAWIAVNFPKLLYIRSVDVYKWQRSKNDSWWANNVQNHGELGKVYPNGQYAMEGDTPSSLYTVGRGLNDPSDPKQRGWGGQFVSKLKNIKSMSKVAELGNENKWGDYYMYGNSLGPQEFKQAIENDFAARMDWSRTSTFSGANHHPVVVLNGDKTRDILKVYAAPGASVSLSAVGTSDPDNNSLTYKWSYYQTDGTYGSGITIANISSQTASVTVPSNSQGKTMHFVVAVSDNGNPSLTSYRRAIVIAGNDPDNTPTVNITSPANGASFETGADVVVTATATPKSGTITKVEFFVDDASIGVDNAAPYTATYATAVVGAHTIKVKATDSQNKDATSTIDIKVVTPPGPYQGAVHAIPGKIEFEHYNEGGNGLAYRDDSPGSETSVNFRSEEDVDIETCTDAGGGYNIGYATAGEWLEYTVHVADAGTYDLTLRVAASGEGRTISIAANGNPLQSDIAIPNTGGWQAWEDVKVEGLALEAGQQVIRVTIGAVDYVNLNYMSFAANGLVGFSPNPAAYQTVNVSLHSGILSVAGASQGSKVNVHNIRGELVAELGNQGGDLSQLQSGILLISVREPSGMTNYFKILKH